MSGRRMSHLQRRGPFMPSMKDQTPTGPAKNWMWKPGASSSKEQKKNLRNKCKHIIDSTDPVVISVGDRVIRSVCQEPDPEFAALHLFCAALDIMPVRGEPWEVVMNSLMDKFDEQNELTVTVLEEADGSQAEEPKTPSRLRGLLRSLVPARLLRRHETTAEAGLHQQSGGGTALSAEAVVASDQSTDDRGGDGEAEACADPDVHAGR